VLSPKLALEQCLERAAAASGAALGRCIDQSLVLLRTAESQTQKQSERNELSDACREIASHGPAWCREYPAALRKAFARAVKPEVERKASPSNFAELSLVGDDEIEQAIISSRLLQHLLPLVERPVSELDALVSSALGHATVNPESNPLRPDIFAQALRTVVARSPASALWMKYLAEPLGNELQAIYKDAAEQLRQANVEAASL
jgi:hypothetical protein